MRGFLILYQVYLNLGEDCRNRILGNIFGISDVSVTRILVGNDNVLIRLFSFGVFYQVKISCHNQKWKIDFVTRNDLGNLGKRKEPLIGLFFECQDERQVYLLLREFL